MAVLVADCPRCGSAKMSFDVEAAHFIGIEHRWQRWYEAFSKCRNCERSTIFVIAQDSTDSERLLRDNALTSVGALNKHFRIEGFISLRHSRSAKCPEFVEGKIKIAFDEGASSVAVGNWNAAGAMFRSSVDLATVPLLPTEPTDGLNEKTRRDLGLRLQWLFDNGRIPGELRDLSKCIHQDGNDAAHRVSLTKDDAADLLDFATALLERLITEPKRIEAAEARRAARRQGS